MKPELNYLNWPEISACFLLLIKIKFKSFRSIRSFRLHIFSSGQFQVELKKISSDQIRSNWIHFSSGQFRSGYFSGQPETWTGQPELFQALHLRNICSTIFFVVIIHCRLRNRTSTLTFESGILCIYRDLIYIPGPHIVEKTTKPYPNLT